MTRKTPRPWFWAPPVEQEVDEELGLTRSVQNSPPACMSITHLYTSVTSELSGAMVCTNLAGGPAQ